MASDDLLPFENEEKGQSLKDEGMRRAAESKPFCLHLARTAAHFAAMRRDTFTASADDIYRICYLMYGLSDSWLGNAAGSVWKGGKWRRLQQYTHSKRVKSHRNMVWVWELLPKYRTPVEMPSEEEVDLHMGAWAEYVEDSGRKKRQR